MKTKILFAVIFSITLVQAQDYYPFQLGNEWVYNILDATGSIIGSDTARCEAVTVSGDTTFYLITNYIDSVSGGKNQQSNLFYNGITDTNEIYRKATNKLLFFKHKYTDGETYSNMFYSTTSNLIGDYVIGTDTFPDCFYLRVNMADSTGFLAAPDIGLIGAIEDSVLIRELKSQNVSHLIKDLQRICAGDSIMIHSKYEKETGVYVDSLINSQGGDSVLVTTLIVDPIFETELDIEICDNEFYFAEGANQTTDGTYYDTLSTIQGCDSVIITNLTVNPIQRSISDVSICQGEEYFAGGANQTTAGDYYDTLSTVLGCDSIIITNLTVNSTYNTSVDVDICEGEEYFAGGANQSTSGTYTDTFSSVDGCDSVIVTNLTVSVCTSLDEDMNTGSFRVYPNPTSGLVHFEVENLVSTQIFNICGKLIVESSTLSVDLTPYPVGIYYVKAFTSDHKIFIRKVMLRR